MIFQMDIWWGKVFFQFGNSISQMFFGLIDFHPVVTVVYFHFVGPWCHFTSFLKNIDSPLSLNDPWSIYQSQNTSGPAETKDCDGSETQDKVALMSQAVKGFIDTG